MKMPWESPSEDDVLNERMASAPQEGADGTLQRQRAKQEEATTPAQPHGTVATGADYCQWSAGPNETFRPSGPRREALPSGIYRVDADSLGPFFVRANVVTDHLIELDDAASKRVLGSISTFWKSRHEYEKRGVLYKRGLLLWGPAGSGKTATISLLMRELLSMKGLVFLCQNPTLLAAMLSILRRIEPMRNLIVVFEDIDELISRFGEHDLLALLDGESQIDNVVNIATTNYPERLGPRIVNRPSRFDERILVGMPSPLAREKYLRHITRNEAMSEDALRRWVKDTEGFSVAHLRELVVAVFCLKQPFEDVVERLSKMQYQPQALKEFRTRPFGLAAAQSIAVDGGSLPNAPTGG